MRKHLAKSAILLLVFPGLFLSCASPSKVREYSGELVLPYSVPHPVFEGEDYNKLVVKVFANQNQIRLEGPQAEWVVLFDNAKNEGRLLLNRDHLRIANPTDIQSVSAPEIKKFIRLPPSGNALVVWPRTIFWTLLAQRFMPSSSDKSRSVCDTSKEKCQRVGEEIIGGRVAEKWDVTSPIILEPTYVWIDKDLGIPIKRTGDFEIRNFVQTRQDPSRFNFPEGYEEMR